MDGTQVGLAEITGRWASLLCEGIYVANAIARGAENGGEAARLQRRSLPRTADLCGRDRGRCIYSSCLGMLNEEGIPGWQGRRHAGIINVQDRGRFHDSSCLDIPARCQVSHPSLFQGSVRVELLQLIDDVCESFVVTEDPGDGVGSPVGHAARRCPGSSPRCVEARFSMHEALYARKFRVAAEMD